MNDPSNQQDQPLILALDTSARSTGIALAHGEQIIARLAVEGDERRSERLWLDIAKLLEGAGLSVEAVDLFAVCVGPGGFTGLRVGIAAVKGLAAATGKPVAGVTSLEAAAMAASGATAVCAMVGAYKGEAYSQHFTFDARGLPVARSAPVVSTSTEVIAQVADFDVVFVGDAAEANVEMIREVAGASVRQANESVAEAVARVAYLKWQHGAVEAAAAVEAVYVRPAEAEVKRSLGLLGSKIARSRRAD
ncbi:MAG TPA: tRNA (adenosine(37)-N6)-threonylcarbamoyltransferase complex dimerization subunit type 1 TsaB [Blastocatellia bacterium]|nr:tRNA (adenosine(37)-N6)-threonylcarbamoyltransferase complex dimerization subunit type 1 TsaB [Blastocatellia bacterium]